MALIVNGLATSLRGEPTLKNLLLQEKPESPFAIALNGEFLPRADYEHCCLRDGDCIEIVHAAAGG
jgi:sulfur carrier protein